MDNRVGSNNSSITTKLDVSQSRARQTPNTSFGHVLGEGLARSADAVLTAGQLAAPFIPGGAVLSAAITSAGSLKSSVAGGATSAVSGGASANSTGLTMGSGVAGSGGSGGTMGAGGGGSSQLDALAKGGNAQAVLMQESQKMQEMNMSFNMQYLGLQQKMQDESRRFTLISNIMKTKHDTAKNSISNVR